MKLRKQSHCVYYCEYHLVFATKYRRKIFNDGVFAYILERLKEIKSHYPELDIIEINHDEDHVHLLISIPPKMSVGKVVGILKANTSRRLKEKFPFLKRFTGAQMVFGLMDILYQQWVLMKKLSRNIFNTKDKKIQGKRSLYCQPKVEMSAFLQSRNVLYV